MGDAEEKGGRLGERLALFIGVLGLVSGVGMWAVDGERLFAVIAFLVGASALGGWARARRKR